MLRLNRNNANNNKKRATLLRKRLEAALNRNFNEVNRRAGIGRNLTPGQKQRKGNKAYFKLDNFNIKKERNIENEIAMKKISRIAKNYIKDYAFFKHRLYMLPNHITTILKAKYGNEANLNSMKQLLRQTTNGYNMRRLFS